MLTVQHPPLATEALLADAVVAELRSARLLLGRSGAPAVDLAALRPGGVLGVDARIRLEPRPAFDPYLRRLRRPAKAAVPEEEP